MQDAFYIRRMWSFSRALDLALIDEEVERGLRMNIGKRHGERVAYIAFSVGQKLGMNKNDLAQLMVAGLLHDIGAIGGFQELHGSPRLMVEHCFRGEAIVERFPDGKVLAPVVRFHHEAPAPEMSAIQAPTSEVPLMAKIISLADKVDLALSRRLQTRQEREKVIAWVKEGAEFLFYPEMVDAFVLVAQKEAFWLDLEQADLLQISLGMLLGEWRMLPSGELGNGYTDYLAGTFADLIDQKSRFTATHSRSVAENVTALAKALNWQDQELHEIYLAGLLHDLGKLAVPRKILDKPGSLDPEEVEVIRTHTYYTHRLLTDAGFPTHMVYWAAYHHERLDGRGYPFMLTEQELDKGARLMTIADIYTALTEDRPYRKALSPAEAVALLRRGVGASVDSKLVDLAERVLV